MRHMRVPPTESSLPVRGDPQGASGTYPGANPPLGFVGVLPPTLHVSRRNNEASIQRPAVTVRYLRDDPDPITRAGVASLIGHVVGGALAIPLYAPIGALGRAPGVAD
jgi:hypothetical protein